MHPFGNSSRLPNRQLRRLVLAAAVLAVAGGASAQSIKAPAGEIRGAADNGLEIFRGIPFAEAPVGALRWAPPQPKAPFAQPFLATSPGNECVQFAAFWRPGKPASWTEDCLSLTVYRPAGGGRNLPVFVGYHGGGSINGAKSDWDPREMAAAGNIVVTPNYRLGAMGYLALTALNRESKDGQSSGNYGDLDKVQALRWVKDNIAAFGGNPNRVTIAGQSAGARGICFLLASPEAKGLFHGAVMESGSECASVPNADVVKMGDKFAQTIGCGEAADKLACLRQKSPADILSAQAASGISFPTVAGGYALPKGPLDAFRSGDFNRVPIIVGNNRNESRVFIYEANDLQKQPMTRTQFEATIRARFGDKAAAVLDAYKTTADRSAGLAQGDVDTDQRYVCGTAKVIDAVSMWTRTYAYVFADETAPIRGYANVPSSFDLGVPHSAELPYLWGENTVPNGLSAAQQKLAKLMRTYWMSLADTAGMAAAAGQADWPAYTPERRQRIVFSAGGQTALVTQDDYLRSHHCDLFTP